MNRLNDEESLILAIMLRYKRGMSASDITNKLKKYSAKISRPTISKYMNILKNKGFIEEI